MFANFNNTKEFNFETKDKKRIYNVRWMLFCETRLTIVNVRGDRGEFEVSVSCYYCLKILCFRGATLH